MAKKMGKGLTALSSTAILSVYGVGYVLTQPAAATMAAGLALPDTSVSPAAPSGSPAATAAPAQAPVRASASSSASPTSTTTLKDGTYSGSGMSRHGGVSVRVTVQNGRIVSAPITGVTTRYSQSVIAGLPASVVAAQGSKINLVSGATDSSMAYQQALAQALSQAQSSAAQSTSGTVSTSAAAAANTSATSPAGSQGSATGLTGAPDGSVQVTGPNGPIYSNGAGRRNRTGASYGQ